MTQASAGPDWTPEFPGQRPPFGSGNEAALVHGARSERRVGPLAERIVAELLAGEETPGHLREPAFRFALMAWGRAEAACELLRQFLDGQSIEDALTEVTSAEEDEFREGKSVRRASVARRVAAALDTSRRWEAHAANLRGKLGLDPASAAKVGKDIATRRYLTSATPLDDALTTIEARRRGALESGSASG